VLQLPPLHDAHPDDPPDPVAGGKSPPLLKAHADINLSTFPALQRGQLTVSSCLSSSDSNCSLQFLHLYS
jgi:hypothetical protein